MVSGCRDVPRQYGRPRRLCAGQSATPRRQAGPACETLDAISPTRPDDSYRYADLGGVPAGRPGEGGGREHADRSHACPAGGKWDAIPGRRGSSCRAGADEPGRQWAGRTALPFRYRHPSGRRVARAATTIGSCHRAGRAPTIAFCHRAGCGARAGADSGSSDSRLDNRGGALEPCRRATARARRGCAQSPVCLLSSRNSQPAGGQQAPCRARPCGPTQDAGGRGCG